jgi:hypothetical protein
MTPTTRLRFIERVVPAPEHGEDIGKRVRILQQWWTVTGTEPEFQHHFGHWQDIPLEAEE